MSAPVEPSREQLSPDAPAAGSGAPTRRLTAVLAGLVLAAPLALVGGWRGMLRWTARMTPGLAAIARRLAHSPLPARMLALAAMLTTLTVALAGFDLAGASIRDARIGLLLGGGAAVMALPRWLGWPDKTLAAVAILALTTGLSSSLLLATTLPAYLAWLLAASEVWLVLLFGSFVLILLPGFLRGRTSLVGTLASALGGLLLVSLGAECVGIGITSWLDLRGQGSGPLAGVLLLATVVWLGAWWMSRIETRSSFRRAGRLLAWRSGLLRLGGVIAGVAAGVATLPAAGDVVWPVVFNTPLEGLTSEIAYLIGALTGLLMAAIFALLPGLLARLQLSGRLAANAAAEAGWFAALALLVATGRFALVEPVAAIAAAWLAGTRWAFAAREVSFPVELLSYVVPVVLATLTHTAIRLLLGRVPKRSAIPLWIFLPENRPPAASLDCALLTARAWSVGPVTLVAPPPVALMVRGKHLRLAQQAGLLPALFVDRLSQAASWRRLRLPAEQAWNGLPFGELYGAGEAWRAAFAELSANARTLVIIGSAQPAWDAAFFKALPAGSELLCQRADAVPATNAGVLRHCVDLSQPSLCADWLAAFAQRNTPAALRQRRILVLYHAADALLGQRLALALDGTIDPAGRQVIASPLDVRPSGSVLLQMDARTLETVIGLAARFAAALGEAPRASLFVRLIGLVASYVASVSALQIDLVVIEASAGPLEGASTARGLESDADSVISLLPANASPDLPRLYAADAYTGMLRLPPASALDERGLGELAQRLVAGDGLAALLPAGPVAAARTVVQEVKDAPTPTSRVFISYRREDAAGWAGRLAADLQREFPDAEVFQDIASTGSGEDFVDALRRVLESCAVAIVLIGPRWLEVRDDQGRRRLDDPDDWVRREIEESLQRPGLRVVPLLVGNATMPRAADLPASLRLLTLRNAHEISDRSWDHDLASLVESLQSAVSGVLKVP
ncbi:MAG: toll/interleukin-1 receptor domain-containing protein [Candidatus Accumulibacter sp.]|uniref:Toll/interleukin-1 receptor domain-containing protein n=1 Tax=Candidatus Accumulibacter affinis TaxID=2954384 RepID=A0A935W2Q6_9PROT|nr:toll/interleukin-1 receptor domain-containing protein [Candidatus Accumulibacter affinis]